MSAALASRWKKLLGDVRAERGRLALLAAAIALSLTAVGAVLGAFTILTREMDRSYRGTRPAAAALELDGDVDDAIVARVRSLPGVRAAVARDRILARASLGENAQSRPLQLFVVDDFADLPLGALESVGGAWPPPVGTMLVERTALGMLETAVGRTVEVRLPGGSPRAVVVSGVVHDPALAPAPQERQGYGYIDRDTLAQLGGGHALHALWLGFDDETSLAAIEGSAAGVAAALSKDGHGVHQLRVPPPHQHPHQRQMRTILWMMLSFSGLSLLLSAVLMATSLGSMMARQVREIGVMKAVGAGSGQIAALYVVLVGGLSVTALLLSTPPALLAARALAGQVSALLNFDLVDQGVAAWVALVQVLLGIGVPLSIAAVPIGRAARVSVRAALDQFGVEALELGQWSQRLPHAWRNALRRPRRTLLVVGLLAVGAATFMTALNVSRSWTVNLHKVDEQRDYDVEVRLSAAASPAVVDQVRRSPSVAVVEAWGYGDAAIAVPGQIDLVRTYPDGGHGSLVVMAPPPGSTLVHFPVTAGRWLDDDDDDAVVLNQGAFEQAGRPALGQIVLLSMDGHPVPFRLVGTVEEIGAAGVAYVATGVEAGRLLRIVAVKGAPTDVVAHDVEALLVGAGAAVELASPLSELEMAVDGHIGILIQMLLALALIMGLVGALGMGSTMSVSVLERTRELGVLLAIGATPRRLQRMIVAEAVAIGVVGWAVGVTLSLPLTLGVGSLIGSLGFMAALPFVVAPGPIVVWFFIAIVVSAAASWLPAAGVSRRPVREALAYT
ncbi:MAG: ABC transporter permease [Deltaproteobacteria bacterium]|nr:ABC transporter permease [Deltaproteobacteria bacterium]